MNRKYLALTLLGALGLLLAIMLVSGGDRNPRGGESLREPVPVTQSDRDHDARAESEPAAAASPAVEVAQEDERTAMTTGGYRRRVPRDAAAPERTWILGRVVNPGGAGVQGATVELLLALGSQGGDAEVPMRPRTTRLAEAVTGTTGGFQLEGPAYAFRLLLRATAKELLPVEVEVREPVGGGTTDVGIIELSAPGYVEGIVVDSSGKGVEGAQIVWKPGEEDSPTLARVAAERYGAISNAAGEFQIKGLPQGRLRFAAVAGGTVSTWTHPYYVKVGNEASELRALGYKGAQQVRIELGRATGLHGHVLDRRSRAAVAARVVAIPTGPAPTKAPWVETTTDAVGRFELTSLLPDLRYGLLVTSPGYQDRAFPDTFVWRGSGTSGLAGVPLEQLTGEGQLIELDQAYDVHVHVRDSDSHEPIAGASIAWVGGQDWFDAFWRSAPNFEDAPAVAVTDEAGDAVVSEREDVLGVSLQARIPGYFGPHELQVREGGVRVIDAVRGKRLTVLVVDQRGEAVADAEVELRRVDWTLSPRALPVFRVDNTILPVSDRLLTDRDGKAVFHAPPRYARIRATARGRGCAMTETIRFDDPRAEYDLTSTLLPPATLTGLVTVSREPASAYEVVAVERGDRGASLAFHATTDARGRFVIGDLAPGQYAVMALSPDDPRPGEGALSLPLVWNDPPPLRSVFLKPGDSQQLELLARPRYGRVLAAVLRDGAPVPGILVSASELPNRYSLAASERSFPGVLTDDEGRCPLRLPRGEWALSAWTVTADGKVDDLLKSVSVFVESGESVGATIDLPRSEAE